MLLTQVPQAQIHVGLLISVLPILVPGSPENTVFWGIPISSTQVLTFTVICFLKMTLNKDPGLSMKLALASHAKDPRFNILAPKRQNVTSLLSACLV